MWGSSACLQVLNGVSWSCIGRFKANTDLRLGLFLLVRRVSIRHQDGLKVRALIVLVTIETTIPKMYFTKMLNLAPCAVCTSSGQGQLREGGILIVE